MMMITVSEMLPIVEENEMPSFHVIGPEMWCKSASVDTRHTKHLPFGHKLQASLGDIFLWRKIVEKRGLECTSHISTPPPPPAPHTLIGVAIQVDLQIQNLHFFLETHSLTHTQLQHTHTYTHNNNTHTYKQQNFFLSHFPHLLCSFSVSSPPSPPLPPPPPPCLSLPPPPPPTPCVALPPMTIIMHSASWWPTIDSCILMP